MAQFDAEFYNANNLFDAEFVDNDQGFDAEFSNVSQIIRESCIARRATTSEWDALRGFVPSAGELIVYTDHEIVSREIDGETREVFVPAIKVGDGMAYVQDLPFVDDGLRLLIMTHINNTDVHVTAEDRSFWNNKINVEDSHDIILGELENETLVLNRN